MKLYKRNDGSPHIFIELKDIISLVPIINIKSSLYTTKENCKSISINCDIDEYIIAQWFTDKPIENIKELFVLPVVKCILEKGNLDIYGLSFKQGVLINTEQTDLSYVILLQKTILKEVAEVIDWYSVDSKVDILEDIPMALFCNYEILRSKIKLLYTKIKPLDTSKVSDDMESKDPGFERMVAENLLRYS